jgi:hypothetical protein
MRAGGVQADSSEAWGPRTLPTVPHPAHFLQRLDRVPRSLTDFALELYRDPERVRWIIHYAHLPASEERVAFALGAGGGAEGPYVVLTREGHFVTALGAEMTPKNLTVLSRAQVDRFSDRVKDARARFELAKEIVPPGKEPEDVLNLLETRAWSITREQLTAIAAWSPIFAVRFLTDLYAGLELIDEVRRTYLTQFDKEYRNDPNVKAGLLGVWSDTHAIGSRLVLATMGDLAFAEPMAGEWPLPIGPTFPATNERIHSVAIRGAWAAARMGRGFVPAYKRILSTPGAMMGRYDAMLAMTAIGLRHARYKDDARRAVAALAETASQGDAELERIVVAASLRALDDPEAGLADAVRYGAALLVVQEGRLPEGSPYKFTRMEDVPRELALLVAANAPHDSVNPIAFGMLPWVAQLERPEELYYPAEMERALGLEWTPDAVEKVYERHKGGKQEPVVRGGPRVGRNEPCPCRSGRKYKRCCGG